MDKQEDPGNKSKNIAANDVPVDGDSGVQRSAGTGSPDSHDEEIAAEESMLGDEGFVLAPEELPTMQWSDVYAELAEFEDLDINSSPPKPAAPQPRSQSSAAGPLEGLEDAMAWLEELAAGQGIPIDEMPTLVSTKPNLVELPAKKESQVSSRDDDEQDDFALAVDSDPMAWLEQLAVDQSSPLEELPSVADRLLASDIVSQPAIPPDSTINDPNDIDEALHYLEKAAVKQGVDLSKVEFDANKPLDNLKAALTIVDGLALTGLAARTGVREDEKQTEEISGAQPAPESRVPAEQPAEVDIIEEELDYDEAVALTLLPEVDDSPDSVATTKANDLSAEMPADPHEALNWLSAMGDMDDVDQVAVVVEEDTIASGKGHEQAASEEAESEKELHSEAAGKFDDNVLQEMPDDPDEAVAWMENLARLGEQDSAASGKKQSPEIAAPPVDAPGLDQKGALAALADGDLEKAFAPIQTILDHDAATPELVKALQEAVEQHEDSPRLLRLLGDAYMQIGEIDKAVATYRKGFDHL